MSTNDASITRFLEDLGSTETRLPKAWPTGEHEATNVNDRRSLALWRPLYIDMQRSNGVRLRTSLPGAT